MSGETAAALEEIQEQMAREFWMVVRTDESGNNFLVKDDLSLEQSRELITKFESVVLSTRRQTWSKHRYTTNDEWRSLVEALGLI